MAFCLEYGKNCSKYFKKFRKCVPKMQCNFKPIKMKKFIKLVKNHFRNKYSYYLISKVLNKLIQEKQLNLK